MTLVLSHSDVTTLLDREISRAEIRTAIEAAHADLALGRASAPAPPAMALDDATLIPMVALDGASGLATVKMLADIPGNAARGLPVQRSTIMVTSACTGGCEALIDGRLITAVRTAATSAVATRHLARPNSSVLGLIGAGALAIEHTRAITSVLAIDSVMVWSRSTDTVHRYRDAVADLGIAVKAANSVEEVARSVDVLCTLTPSREPIVSGIWFGDGLHVNAIGAPPRPDHREIDGVGMGRSRVVVDSLATAMTKSGEVVMALAEGAIDEPHISTELGAVIAGLATGRTHDRDITLFNSVGLGLQDLVTAGLLLDRARAVGIGTELDLSA